MSKAFNSLKFVPFAAILSLTAACSQPAPTAEDEEASASDTQTATAGATNA